MASSSSPRTRGKRNASPSNPANPVSDPGGNGDTGGSQDSPADRLAVLLEQFAGGAAGGYRAYVERLQQDGESEYLGGVAFDENFYDTVREQYGGGRFAARIIQGKKYCGRVPPFRIGGKPRDDSPASAPKPAELAAPTLADSLAAALKPLNDRIDALSRRPEPPAVDPIQAAVNLVNAFRSIAGPPIAAPAADANGTLGMLNTVLELQDRLSERQPKPSSSSGVAEAIREIAPLLTKAFEGNQSPAPETMPRDVAMPTAPPAIVAPWLKPFLQWKRQLLALADSGRNPELYAAVFNDSLDEPTAALLVAAINAGTVTQDVFAAFPELSSSSERRIFAGKLVTALEGMFEDEETSTAPAAEE